MVDGRVVEWVILVSESTPSSMSLELSLSPDYILCSNIVRNLWLSSSLRLLAQGLVLLDRPSAVQPPKISSSRNLVFFGRLIQSRIHEFYFFSNHFTPILLGL